MLGILVGMDQKDFFAATQLPSPLLALYALGNLDCLRAWYLAATCSVLVLPDCCSEFFWELTSGFIPVFSAIWFDNGYMFLSVYEGLGFAGGDTPRAVLPEAYREIESLVRAFYNMLLSGR